MNQSSPNPPTKLVGFRCSKMDQLVLMLAGLASFFLARVSNPMGWVVAVVTVHFFLFCNVLLVWRRWELLWAVYFSAIVMWRFAHGDWTCFPTLWYVLPATVFVILLQMRSPFYHGIFARRINPRLDAFLNNELS